MKRKIKLLVSILVHIHDLSRAALLRALGRNPPPRCVVLYYHAVPAQHRALFARQMDLLLQLTRPLPSDPTARLEPGQQYAVVTFDDGFVSVKDHAAPELQRRQIPWTIFVPSGCLGQSPAWLRHAHPAAQHDRVMTAEELRALTNDPLVTIGSHTVKHAHLVEVGPDRARLELAQSKADLEAVLGRPVTQFSYPFGARTPALDQQARSAGYSHIFCSKPEFAPVPTLNPQPSTAPIGRISVDPDTPLFEFRLKLLGAYRWLAKRDV